MTAMQELLIHFNEKNESGWFTMDEIEQAILDFGIPAEKQQIESTWWAGHDDGVVHNVVCPPESAAILYYNNLFYAHQPPRTAT